MDKLIAGAYHDKDGRSYRKAHNPNKTYGCDGCTYLKGKRCSLWELTIDDPHDCHCESHNLK